jgi:hypothetical protein
MSDLNKFLPISILLNKDYTAHSSQKVYFQITTYTCTQTAQNQTSGVPKWVTTYPNYLQYSTYSYTGYYPMPCI